MIVLNSIDMLNTMYPSKADKVCNTSYLTMAHSTVYGYVLSGEVKLTAKNTAVEGQYFSLWTNEPTEIEVVGECVFFTRLGFKGQNTVGGPIEDSGRLVYIDTCSDSLLVYPPRMGDPSLNLLNFPAGVNQSFHIHPSLRLGVVAKGSGIAWTKMSGSMHKRIELKEGTMFCLEEREIHRFSTESETMTVIAYHPDGDWGPTDHNHTMLNRTYITNK